MAPAGQGLCQSAIAGIFGPFVGSHYELLLFFFALKEKCSGVLTDLASNRTSLRSHAGQHDHL